MARDYSKSSRSKKRRPAARPKNELPGWVQMFVGLTIGLCVAAAVFIYYKPLDSNLAGDGPPRGSDAEEQQAQDENGLPPEEPGRFAFYDMLPNYEIVIQYEDENGNKTRDPKTKEKPKTKTAETPKQVEQPGKYIIQAGSFKSYEDADKRKAKLALIGMESAIERVTIDDTKTWYRVRVGPVNDIDTVNGMLKRLRDNGIETLLMRHRG
ncbi:MAG: SPOR domain-containing protein [Nevskiales bacterium]